MLLLIEVHQKLVHNRKVITTATDLQDHTYVEVAIDPLLLDGRWDSVAFQQIKPRGQRIN